MRRATFLKRMAFAAMACALVELPDLVPAALKDGERVWIRATLDADHDDEVKFFTAPGGINIVHDIKPEDWTPDHSGMMDLWGDGRSFSFKVLNQNVAFGPTQSPFGHEDIDIQVLVELPGVLG
ncbi:MAG: hypothetical protein KAJ19_21765 [Gammaproteobacteria bacterium]|nr:hypothetical protein [Gammaproteobacteria bacterium]